MISILVTGGAGFIGSHTCLNLLEKGYKIYVLDSFCNSSQISLSRVDELYISRSNNLNCLEIIKGDLRDKSSIEEIFKLAEFNKDEIKGVIHFAGLKSVKESMHNPLLYWQVNLQGSLNLFEIMKKYSCKTIVFSSSATIYGNNTKEKIKETEIIAPINPYGKTKAAIEQVLHDLFFSDPKNWRIVNLRYFNPIGAHPSGLIGENPKNFPNNIFPLITKVAIGKIDKIKIFGNDWPTHDGTGIRDYIHVMDLSEGHVKALDLLLNEEPQIINLNLGNGIGVSVMELINTFEKVNKVKLPYIITERRIGDVAKIVADNSLAFQKLKWSPKRTIEEMCIDGWKWQKLNPDGFKFN